MKFCFFTIFTFDQKIYYVIWILFSFENVVRFLTILFQVLKGNVRRKKWFDKCFCVLFLFPYSLRNTMVLLRLFIVTHTMHKMEVTYTTESFALMTGTCQFNWRLPMPLSIRIVSWKDTDRFATARIITQWYEMWHCLDFRMFQVFTRLSIYRALRCLTLAIERKPFASAWFVNTHTHIHTPMWRFTILCIDILFL